MSRVSCMLMNYFELAPWKDWATLLPYSALSLHGRLRHRPSSFSLTGLLHTNELSQEKLNQECFCPTFSGCCGVVLVPCFDDEAEGSLEEENKNSAVKSSVKLAEKGRRSTFTNGWEVCLISGWVGVLANICACIPWPLQHANKTLSISYRLLAFSSKS